ncbi:hypothetical protein ACFE04_008661 [Oxalis oulophora]
MAMRTVLKHVKHNPNNTQWRLISLQNRSVHTKNEIIKSPKGFEGDLKSQILGLKFARRSATTVIQNWVDEGHKVSGKLRYLATQLTKSKRYKHALEILTWMETQSYFMMAASDHAMRMELIVRVRSLTEAEDYFATLQNTVSRKAACLPLLHGYVKEKATDKAEALMTKMIGLGLGVTPHPYNEMMKLYVATSVYEKVPLVISQMKHNRIPLNVLSYNLWMNSCGQKSEVNSVEMVYREMLGDKNVQVGWSTRCTLANTYIKAGSFDKAAGALKQAEKKISNINRLGYFFIITLYASLKDRDGVLRLWEASKAVDRRTITCADYMCILSCLLKVDDLQRAEMVFNEWESNSRNYDVRVSNILLGAYMRKGLIQKAESFHLHTLEKGGHPNYKTWEILMEGWVRSQNMDKAIDAMKKGFSKLKGCEWRPSKEILITIAEYLEKNRDVEGADRYIRDIRRLGLGSLALYKVLLKLRIGAKRSGFDIVELMQKDKIEMDDESFELVKSCDS